MKGLLVKDICLILQHKKFLAMILLVSAALNFSGDDNFSIGYLTFICSFFIINTITYDEYENGFRFLFTLPIRRNTYVRSKYVFAVLLCMMSWVTACLIAIACYFAKNQIGSIQEGVVESCIFLPIILIFMSVMLPVQFKFGTEKGRIIMAFFFCGCVMIGYLVEKMARQVGVQMEQIMQFADRLLAQPTWILVSAVVAITVIILGISYWVSIAVMRQKEF